MATRVTLKAINDELASDTRLGSRRAAGISIFDSRGRGLAGPNRERADGQQLHAKGVDRGIPTADEAKRTDHREATEGAICEARLPRQRLGTAQDL
jgi:hypothetical protein